MTKKVLLLFAILFPILFCFLFVYLFGVNVPVEDQWDMVRIFKGYFSGNLTLKYLFDNHVDHRIFFPKLAMLFIGLLSNYNNIAELWFIQLILVSIFLLIYHSAKHLLAKNSKYIFLILSSFLVFSLRQWENILWGFQISFLMALLFSLLSFFLMQSYTNKSEPKQRLLFFVFAILCAIIASFSSAMGLLTWPCLFLQLILSGYSSKLKQLCLLILFSTSIPVFILYFTDFRTPPKGGGYLSFLLHPLEFMSCFFSCVGSSLFWHKHIALLAGTILVSLFALTMIKYFKAKLFNSNLFFITSACYSILTLLLVSASRFKCGDYASLTSRYTSFSILFVISLLILIIKYFSLRNISTITLLSIIIISLPLTYMYGLSNGKIWKLHKDCLASILKNYTSQPDELYTEFYFPSAEKVKEIAPILESLNFNVFSQKYNGLVKHEELNKLKIEYTLNNINNIRVSQASRPILFHKNDLDYETQYGLCYSKNAFLQLCPLKLENVIFISGNISYANRHNGNVLNNIYIQIDGNTFGICCYQKMAQNSQNNSTYCFERAIPTKYIGPGRHALSLAIALNDGQYYTLSEQSIDFILPDIALPQLSALSAIDAKTYYAVDAINWRPAGTKEDPAILSRHVECVIISGWAVDVVSGSLAAGIYIDIDGTLHEAEYGILRGDVATCLDNPVYQQSGFDLKLPVSQISDGSHEVSMYIVNFDATGYYDVARKWYFTIQ